MAQPPTQDYLTPAIVGTPTGCSLWMGEKDVELSIITGPEGSWEEGWQIQHSVTLSNEADDIFSGAYISPTGLSYPYSAWYLCDNDYSSTVFESHIPGGIESLHFSKYESGTLEFNPSSLVHIEEGLFEYLGSNRYWDRYIPVSPPYIVYRIAASSPLDTYDNNLYGLY